MGDLVGSKEYIYLHINGDVPYEAICGGYIKGNLDRIE
jgi:hypothetical protein